MLVGKPEINSPFARSRHRWENNIRPNLKKNGKHDIAGFICLGQGRKLGSCEHSNNILVSII